jgi:hypothetical protein
VNTTLIGSVRGLNYPTFLVDGEINIKEITQYYKDKSYCVHCLANTDKCECGNYKPAHNRALV